MGQQDQRAVLHQNFITLSQYSLTVQSCGLKHHSFIYYWLKQHIQLITVYFCLDYWTFLLIRSQQIVYKKNYDSFISLKKISNLSQYPRSATCYHGEIYAVWENLCVVCSLLLSDPQVNWRLFLKHTPFLRSHLMLHIMTNAVQHDEYCIPQWILYIMKSTVFLYLYILPSMGKM